MAALINAGENPGYEKAEHWGFAMLAPGTFLYASI